MKELRLEGGKNQLMYLIKWAENFEKYQVVSMSIPSNYTKHFFFC